MKKHIKLSSWLDFYIKITHRDPDLDERTVVDEHITINATSFNEEQLKDNLDRVNMWIGNCDQKASFILAIIGVVLGICFTSDSLVFIKSDIVSPVISAIGNSTTISLLTIFEALLLLMLFVSLIMSVFRMIFALRANTDLQKLSQPGMESNSMLHYPTIANMTYRGFCENEVHILNDLRSQFYVNSCICASKFENYKKGVKCLEWSIILSIVLIISLLAH